MDKQPLVSVLVPLYNHARYVDDCLNSILNSDYAHLEVIVLDDGSTDDSCRRVSQWRERHPDAFEDFQLMTQANRGIPETLNRLVLQARGEFVTLLASDDYLLSQGVLVRVKALREQPHWLAVIGDCVVVDEHNKLLHSSGLTGLFKANKKALSNPNFIKNELAIRWSVPGPVFMARKKVYDPESGVGLYNSRLSVEDRDFYLRLLNKEVLGFVDHPVAAYRIHTQNAFKHPQRRLEHLDSMARVEQAHLKDFRGLAKLGIWLRLQNYKSVVALETKRTFIKRVSGRLAREGLRFIYWLHIQRVHAFR